MRNIPSLVSIPLLPVLDGVVREPSGSLTAGPSPLPDDAPHFRDELLYEIHRADRSHRPFVLAMLDVRLFMSGIRGGLSSVQRRRISAARLLANTIDECTRETDIKGWYETESALGVIYIDVGEKAINTIIAKLHRAIATRFESEAAHCIKVSAYPFPAERERIRAFASPLTEAPPMAITGALQSF